MWCATSIPRGFRLLLTQRICTLISNVVLKPLKQIVSFYLVLVIAMVGAIGISPTLHRLIEHGGLGPAHSHATSFHSVPRHPEKPSYRELLLQHEHAFQLPALPVAQLWHAIAHLLE